MIQETACWPSALPTRPQFFSIYAGHSSGPLCSEIRTLVLTAENTRSGSPQRMGKSSDPT